MKWTDSPERNPNFFMTTWWHWKYFCCSFEEEYIFSYFVYFGDTRISLNRLKTKICQIGTFITKKNGTKYTNAIFLQKILKARSSMVVLVLTNRMYSWTVLLTAGQGYSQIFIDVVIKNTNVLFKRLHAQLTPIALPYNLRLSKEHTRI